MRVLAFLLVAFLAGLTAFVSWWWMLASAVFGSGQRARRIAIGFDQLGNATSAGDEDETFSSRCWRLRHVPRYGWLQRQLDRAFELMVGELNHCKAAYEAEAVARQRPYKDAS